MVYKVLVPPETVKIPRHCKGKVSEYTAVAKEAFSHDIYCNIYYN